VEPSRSLLLGRVAILQWGHSGSTPLAVTNNMNGNNCKVNKCETEGGCDDYCSPAEQDWLRVSNTKAFLVAGVGLGSWSGRMDVVGFECHDCGLSLESLSDGGFWINKMLTVCRTKSPIVLPENARASFIPANGFRWYDTRPKAHHY
jgi:hypothetical protein